MVVVSIGTNCVVATFLKESGLRNFSLPFDWMLSHPNFIHEMLRLLLEENMDARELVSKHFFLYDKRCTNRNGYNVSIVPDGKSLVNSKYDVVFPHDDISPETIDKYTRRFIRLRDIIRNSSQEKIYFVYSSQNALLGGIYRIDDKIILENVYLQINKVKNILDRHCINYEIIYFDAILNEDVSKLDKKVILVPLEKRQTWPELIPQMKKHLHLFGQKNDSSTV
jgi:hypothetical protein